MLDFGLAKRIPTAANATDVTRDFQNTQEGQLLGTPHYMSPEQALGKELDHRTDIFSVGVILYELATGQIPFAGRNLAEITNNIVHAQPAAIARLNYDVPAELERITIKCLQKRPDRRYQSARELMADLQTLQLALDNQQDSGHATGMQEQPGNRLTHGVTASAEKPASVTAIADPGELTKSDVVITYSNLDDRPLVSGKPGWISQFHQNLHVRVAQLSGKQVAVVKQSDYSAPAELEAQILQQIPNAKTVVSVLSPPFAHSNGCRRIVESFWKTATAAGKFEVGESQSVIERNQDAGGHR